MAIHSQGQQYLRFSNHLACHLTHEHVAAWKVGRPASDQDVCRMRAHLSSSVICWDFFICSPAIRCSAHVYWQWYLCGRKYQTIAYPFLDTLYWLFDSTKQTSFVEIKSLFKSIHKGCSYWFCGRFVEDSLSNIISSCTSRRWILLNPLTTSLTRSNQTGPLSA